FRVSLRVIRWDALRPRPTARRDEVLHHPAGRHRPRWIKQAEQWAARKISALWLQRHGHGAIPAPDRKPRRQSFAVGDGHFNGRDADVALGRTLSRFYGCADAAREPARSDFRP